MMKHLLFTITVIVILATSASGQIDLSTLPTRDTVQLTIYNSADLTLARESRALTLKQGLNKLQFSWANTLIDPTSLEMLPQAQADKIDIFDLTYPPRLRNMGLWNINSEVSGKVPVEITYLTSGLTWRAFYMGTLSPDEKTMRLQGYVRVTNHSGENYENAQTRLIVGKVHILDEIVELARRQYPYGRRGEIISREDSRLGWLRKDKKVEMEIFVDNIRHNVSASKPKGIVKEGLSEYFLYTIEGAETIPNGWSKRLPSFTTDEVPVVNLYKYDENMYGANVVRFLSFKNDEEHKLGETPIPGGILKVYRNVDEQQHLSYEGQSSFKYIPVNEDVELNLGPVADVVVEPVLMDYRTTNYRWDSRNNQDYIIGWDEIRTFKVTVKNTRELPIKVEIKRHFGTPYWDLTQTGAFGEYEKVDQDSAKYTLELTPISSLQYEYILTTYHGARQNEVIR
jgi:hypothetical protein